MSDQDRYPVRDEVLEACARDELRDLGLDEDCVAESLATMRDQGMFDMPAPDVVAAAKAESDAEAWGGRGPSASYAEWLAEGRQDPEAEL
jgi:hypothetical protein